MDKYQALFAFYESRKNVEFEWGKSDCALLGADWLKHYLGQDFAADFRGRYRTAIGSRRLLTRFGFKSLTAAVQAQLGEPLVSPLLAQRGDIVIVDSDMGEAVGIADGHGAMVQSSEGIEHAPIGDVLVAWRVS